MRLPKFTSKDAQQQPAQATQPVPMPAPTPQQPAPVQQVLVPTVVSSEEMLNIIYQQNAEILSLLRKFDTEQQ